MIKELMRKGYIGNPSQLATVRRVTLEEGKARGTEIIEVKTACGLEMDILPNTGLDIGQTRFKGINMSWLSKNGYDSPSSFLPYETTSPPCTFCLESEGIWGCKHTLIQTVLAEEKADVTFMLYLLYCWSSNFSGHSSYLGCL